MVDQNFKVLLGKERRTIRGSALVTLCDTKQGFTVREESKSVWRLGHAIFKFVYFVCVYCICVY